jgi:hypothetical protein
MKHLGPVALLICLIATPLAAWAGSPKSLEENLRAAGRFNTYLELQKLAAPGKSGKARTAQTFLVPNDAAFAKLPPAVLEKLKTNPALARKFLDSHTLPGRVTVDDMVGPRRSKSNQLKSEQGGMLAFKSATTVDGAPPAPTAMALTSETVAAPATAPAPQTVPIAETPIIIPQQNLNITAPPTVVQVADVPNISQVQVIDLGMIAIEPIIISQAAPTTTNTVERAPLVVTGMESAVFNSSQSQFSPVQIIATQPTLSNGGSAYELQSSLFTLFDQSWMSTH